MHYNKRSNTYRSENAYPSVSIGMPVFNGEPYISEAIESILGQTYTNFELIISDNASTDKTENICNHYASIDKRIFYHRNKKNFGASFNYNQVFNFSNGTFFKWAAHDDLLAPTFVDHCVKVLKNNPSAVLCYPKTKLIDKHGMTMNEYTDSLALMDNHPYKRVYRFLSSINLANPVFGLIKADILKTTALIEDYLASDYGLLFNLSLYGKFIEYPEFLFFRRDHRGNIRRLSKFEQLKWYNPKMKISPFNPKIVLYYKYISIIQSSEISKRQKVLCIFSSTCFWFREIRAKLGLLKNYIYRYLDRILN